MWLDAETRTTIMKMFGLKKTCDIIMMSMQQQTGFTDCGVFAIAVMISLAHDEDPSIIKCREKGDGTCLSVSQKQTLPVFQDRNLNNLVD